MCENAEMQLFLRELNEMVTDCGLEFTLDPTRTGIGDDFRKIAEDLGIEIPSDKEREYGPMGGLGSGGNQQKPKALKLLHGTYRRDRDKQQQVKPTKRKPRKPPEIKEDKDASMHWDMIMKTRGEWISESDVATLQTVCETWSLQRRMKALFEQDISDFRLRASYNALTELWAKQAAKLGLDPRSRESLGTVGADDSQNEKARRYLA